MMLGGMCFRFLKYTMTIRQFVVIVFVFLFGCFDVAGAQNVPNVARMTAEQKIGLLKNELIGPAPEQGEDDRELVFIGIERCNDPNVNKEDYKKTYIPKFNSITDVLQYIVNNEVRNNKNQRFNDDEAYNTLKYNIQHRINLLPEKIQNIQNLINNTEDDIRKQNLERKLKDLQSEKDELPVRLEYEKK